MAFLRSLPTKKHPTHKEIYGWGKIQGTKKVWWFLWWFSIDSTFPNRRFGITPVASAQEIAGFEKKKLIGKSEFKGAKRGCFSSLGFCGGIGVCILCFFLFHEIVKQEGCRNFQGGCKQHGWVVFYRFLIVFICLDHFESMGGDSEQI